MAGSRSDGEQSGRGTVSRDLHAFEFQGRFGNVLRSLREGHFVSGLEDFLANVLSCSRLWRGTAFAQGLMTQSVRPVENYD